GGVRRSAGCGRGRTGRGRAAVRRQSGDRRARQGDHQAGVGVEQPGLLLRTPAPRGGTLMRGTIADPGADLGTDLGSPDPIVGMRPAVYQEDEFTGRFTAGLDEVIAPVLAALDCLDAYVDPTVSPPDFLDWLASWVGIRLHEAIPLARRRILVANAVRLHR